MNILPEKKSYLKNVKSIIYLANLCEDIFGIGEGELNSGGYATF